MEQVKQKIARKENKRLTKSLSASLTKQAVIREWQLDVSNFLMFLWIKH